MDGDKTYLDARDYLHDQWRLAEAIRSSGWRPDFIVGLWRGGAPVAIAVHEYFRACGMEIEHLPLKCASYTGIGRNEGEVVFTGGEAVFGLFHAGARVLFVDDVFDTGKTARAVAGRMRATGADWKFACVYWKPLKNLTDLAPDWFVKRIGNDWLVFPHEMDGLTHGEMRRKDPFLAELLMEGAVD